MKHREGTNRRAILTHNHNIAGTLSVLLLGMIPYAAHAAPDETAKTAHVSVNIGGHTAPVRAIAFTPDSKLLCTAGMDKVVHVWRLPEASNPKAMVQVKSIVRERWGNHLTLRWGVGRGLRGSIYALAMHPKTGQLAMAGYSSLGSGGEIVWQDPSLGEYLRAGYEHARVESISTLSYSASGNWMASMSLDGQSLIWPSNGRNPRLLTDVDETPRKLDYRPIVVVGDDLVIMPVYAGQAANDDPIWKLRGYRISRNSFEKAFATEHIRQVTCLAASPDGLFFASADDIGNLFAWQSGQPRPLRNLRPGLPVISLCFSPDGRKLVAGTGVRWGEEAEGAQLQIWDIEGGALLRKQVVGDFVRACAISPDGQRLAYTGSKGHEVFVESLDTSQEKLTIPGGKRVTQVGFVQDGAAYDIAFESLPQSPGSPAASTFSSVDLKMREGSGGNPTPGRSLGRWLYQAEPTTNRLWLYRDLQPMGCVELDVERHGRLISQCWIPGPNGQPIGVAVGTDTQNGVFVYGLPQGGKCPMLRYCRGHYGLVTALGVSNDGKYLVSGATDGTIRFWKLQDCFTQESIPRRWGATLSADPGGGPLVVALIDDLGPLYQKGVRAGDRIDKIIWGTPTSPRQEQRPGEVLGQLDRLAWDQQVAFFTSRNGKARPPFNLRGGWHHIMAFYATDSDWIAWTPAGYYACSAGGERLIGWLVNENEVGKAPNFFTAEQLNQSLHRPDVISALLKAGSLERALGHVGEEEPIETVTEVEPPTVRIVSHQERVIVQDHPEFTVSAVAESRPGHPITALRLHIDGQDRRGTMKSIVRERAPNLRESRQWTIQLEPGQTIIEIVAATDESEGHSQPLYVTYRLPEDAPPQPRPALFVVAVGVSAYQNLDRIDQLKYAHLDAQMVASVLETRAADYFDEPPVIRRYVEEDATRAGIIEGLEWLQANMKQRDVGVFFYSGHGVKDDSGRFHFLPVDGSVDAPGRTCVPGELLKQYCLGTQGNLVLMIDACHSGGIDLRASEVDCMDHLALVFNRTEYRVVMLASSAGDKVSLEREELGAGLFAKAVAEGLLGKADTFKDQMVFTKELDSYVTSQVRDWSNGEQLPVSARSAIADFPLTRTH